MTARKKTSRKPKSSFVRKRRLERKRSEALNFETLERRELLAAITVSNVTDVFSPTADTSSIAALIANDGGDGISLREAVTAANNTVGEDAITFDAAAFAGGDNNLIRLTQGQLTANDSLSIDGVSVGGVLITGDADGDDITVFDSNITDVEASFVRFPGAADDLLDDNSRVLDFSGSGDLTLTGLTITGGRVTADDVDGGGIRFNSTGTLLLDQSTVSGNSTSGSSANGGGISSAGGNVSLTNSTISFNSGQRGGGIYSANGVVTVNSSTINGNNADVSFDDNGGGISSSNGIVSLTNSTISGNSGNRGGGISSDNGVVSLINSTISGNSASSGAGGGIYISDGGLSLFNSTVSGNFSNNSGGGISSRDSTVLFVNSTVTANSARFGTGNGIIFSAVDSDSARLTIHNSIVADNLQGGNFAELRVTGDVTADDLIVEYSLIGRTYGSLIDATTGTGNVLDQSALLSPLADYGGATQTHALLRGSLAIDAGSNTLAVDENGNPLTTDQRGESRILGTVDIGAFELGAEADFETQSLVVNISQDIADPNDGLTSLREAIRFADDLSAGVNNDGDADGDGSPLDTITFDSSVFTGGDNNLIRLTRGQLEIRDSLAIDGSSVEGVVITGDANDDDITVAGTDITDVSASFGGTAGALADLLDDNSRVFDFTGDSGRLILSELTITGGRATEGNSNSYTFFDYGNAGGGIRASFDTNVSLTNSTVSGNSTIGDYNGDGGGIFANSGRVSLTNSTVSGNRTGRNGDGGGIFGGYVSLTNSIVSGNINGGGISGGYISLTNSVVSGNSSNDSGGGISSRGNVSLANSTVSGNSSVAGGGGISAGEVSLRNSAVSGNVAGRGGGGIQADNVSSINGTISENASGYGGGGISADDVFLTYSTVNGNVAARDGGGIRANDVSVTSSTVSGNISRSRYGGGGISSRDGNVSLINSTVSGNSSDVDGGGIRADESTVLLFNSTVTGNSAAVLGGGIRFGDTRGDFSSDESLTLYNSIVAGNGDDGTAPDIFASLDVMNVEHSLIGDTTGFGITATTGTGNILNQLPMLGPLADNGGRTQTHVLLVGSPALNAGSNAIVSAAGVTTDQRGEARIEFGTVDIGAVEVGVETRLIVTTNLDVEDQADGLTSLREAIALANSDVGPDTILFDPIVFDSATTIVIASQLPAITDTLTITGPGANLLSIDAQAGGDNVFDGNGFRIFEVSDGDSSSSIAVSISGLTLTGGDISAAGGAISNFENLILDAVSIVDNRAFFGGGVSNESSGVLSLTNSTIADNQASLNGGGIWTSSALTATNVTISGNSANSNGAAIASAADSSGSTLNLTNVTLTNNMGNSGVYFNNASGTTIATFNNTIVDSSVLGLGAGSNGSTLTGGYNLFVSANPGITGVGNLFNQTSMLGPLADNGGSTLTHALLVGSPAYNAGGDALALDRNGNLLLTDQRGERRNQFNTVDIGAVESEFDTSGSLVVTTSLDVDDPLDGLTSLREAIAFALDPTTGANNDGDADGDGLAEDTITFDAGVFTGGDNSVIRLTQGELIVSETLTIDAASVGGVVITGDANDDDVTLPGTSITDVSSSFGGTDGALDDLLDDNIRVLNFSANGGDLTLTGLTITGGNTSGRYSTGGGIRFAGSSLTLNQSIVSGNSSLGSGGGIYSRMNGDVFLIDSDVTGNYSGDSGGGIRTVEGDLSLTSSTVSENSSGRDGGGIYIGSGDASLNNSSVNGNSSVGDGGGIFSRASNLSLAFSTVSGNFSGDSGGGISSTYRDVSLSNSTVSGNVSDNSGGGIYSRDGDVSLTGSTVSGNSTASVEANGGGVYSRSGDLLFTNSTLSGNSSGGSGGGVDTSSGNISLTNSTVSGNNAGNNGGGISSEASSILLVNSTVADNSASEVGGGISFRNGSFNQDDLLTLQNSIVARNEDSGAAPDVSRGNPGSDLLVENSLIGDSSGSGITFVAGIGNILNQSPLLGPLADNGGPTQTHALLSGSLAINTGSNAIAASAGLIVDQRGEDRVQFGAVDIGAFESGFNERNLVVTTSQDVEDPNDGFTSLREAIIFSSESESIDTIAFDASVFGSPTTIEILSQLPAITSELTITGPGADLLTIDAQGGGDNVLDGDGFRIFEVNDGDSNSLVDVSISGLTLTGGDTNRSGGAISNSENLTLDRVAVVDNRARFGGALNNEFSGVLTVTNSTIANNEAFQLGGGVFTRGDLAATNVTISGNNAASGGGAILTSADSAGITLNLTQSTLSNNTGIGGVIFINGDGPAIATFNNTIIDDSITSVGNTATMLTGNNNLFVSANPGITGTGNLFNQTSMLGPLADNGGPTLTHALLFGSPAINAGDNALAVDGNGNPLATDQRGEARILFDTVDIGAVETRFNELRSLVVTTNQDVVNPSDGLTSLREAIVFANTGVSNTGDADGDGLRADTITFDAGVFAGVDSSVIRLTQGELQISESLTIDGSSVGGVVITGDAEDDDITVAGSHITDVSASFSGTAGASDDLLDDNSRVLNFSAVSGDLTLTDLTVTGGRITDNFEDGGGIEFSSSGTLTLNQSNVSGNSAAGNQADGGGIFSNTGDVLLIDSTVSGNISDRFGGGVSVNFGEVSIIESTVSENISQGGGGVSANTGDVSLVNSTVSENISNGVGVGGNGAGIRNVFGNVSLTNSTVSGNSSLGSGGGVFATRLLLTNSTVTGNSASEAGGGIAVGSIFNSVLLQNSIVAGNEAAGTAPDLSTAGSATINLIVENSLIGDTTGSGITSTTGTGNVLNQLPLLGPLADNGGPTQTHALLSGSLGINAGSNAIAEAAGLITDQRGEVRIQFGSIDIGAFESDFNEGNFFVTTNQDVVDPDDQFISLREAIIFANQSDSIDTIRFDSDVFSGLTTIDISSELPTITDALTIAGPGANLLTIDAQGGGDNVLDGNGYRVFAVNDGDSISSVDVSIIGVTLTGGDNSDSGGAINNFENLTLDGVSVVGNRAGSGGGFNNELTGRLTIINSTIANNQASDNGGGIANRGDLIATNVTVSGNETVGSGGAIFNAAGFSGAILNLTQSTVTNNTGSDGVHFYNGGSVTTATFNNTIIDSSITGDFINGTILTGNNNLFASADPGIMGVGNLFSQTPLLGPLADNGGSTLTHALLPGSPAFDAGDSTLAVDGNGIPLSTDQRGEDRIQVNAVDIGAFEAVEFRSLIVTTTQDVVNADDGVTSLREAIAFAFAGFSNDGDADGDGLRADTITFDASVFTGGENSVIRLTQGELSISDTLTIDGSSVGGVVITGDADGDDILVAGTQITDVIASLGNDASTDLLDDNSRVFNLLDSNLFNASNVTLTGLTITGGRVTGENGGGVRFNSSGTLTLNESTVGGNIAAGISVDGGGIYASFGDVSLNNSSVSGNVSDEDGGGIRTIFGNLSLTNSTVSGNISGRDGGGISTSFVDVTLINSTVSGNIGGRDGGGIGFNDSNIILVNSTVTANSASRTGGGISFRSDSFFQEDRLTLHNSIVSGNTDGGAAPDVLASGAAIDLIVEHSLIGDTTGFEVTATSGTGNILNQSALLGPLADNGGPTLTHALLPGSPAVDAGSNDLAVDADGNPLTTDQRGENRFVETVDIGAVESGVEDLFLLGDTNQDSAVNFLDISPFISLLSSGTFLDQADTNRDGVVDFLDISPFISLLTSGGPSTDILLGDANQSGVVDFLDISPFVSLLSSGTFLDQADTNRDGVVDFLDISPFISLLTSGGPSTDILLGDANQSGVVDFLDISPFVSLLTSNTFLDEADVNRDGNVDFLDISPFISLLNSGASAQGKLVSGDVGKSAVASGATEKSEASVAKPLDSSSGFRFPGRAQRISRMQRINVRSRRGLCGPNLMTLAPNASLSQTRRPTTTSAEAPLVLVNNPMAQASELPAVDASLAGELPVDTFIGPVAFALSNYSFVGAGDSSLRVFESKGPLVARQPLVRSAERLDFSPELREALVKPPSANVSTENTF